MPVMWTRRLARTSAAVASIALAAAALSPARAQVVPPRSPASIGDWTLGGIEVCPDILWPHRQPAVASDGHGGVYVAWQDWRNRTAANLYAQHFDSRGQMLWQKSARPVSQQAGDEAIPQALADGAGGMLVAWMDFRNPLPGVYLQHFTGSGVILPGWVPDGIPLAAGTQQGDFSTVADGAGGVLVATREMRDGVQGVYAYRVGGDGVPPPGWPASGLALTADPTVNYDAPSIASDGAGGALIAWSLRGPFCGATCEPAHALEIAHVRDGVVVWSVADSSASLAPSLASDGGGGALALSPTLDASFDGTHVRDDGSVEWSQPLLSGPSAGLTRAIVPDRAGGAYVAWEDSRNDGSDLYALHITGDGSLAAGWPADGLPLCTISGRQTNPVLFVTVQGYLFAVWEDVRYVDKDLFCTLLRGDGSFGPPINQAWTPGGNIFAHYPGDQGQVAMADDGAAGVFIVWQDMRSGRDQVFVQHVTLDFATAASVSLVTSEATPDEVRLRWRIVGADGGVAVERRGPREDWTTLATSAPDGLGDVTFVDRSVVPGAAYDYRLEWSEAGVAHTGGDVHVDVPVAAGFSLSAPRPNPAAGAFSVAFSLAGGAAARLEVLDVAGRRVWSRDVTSAGPGAHVEAFSGAPAWPAGVYLVRLVEGGRERVARLAIAR